MCVGCGKSKTEKKIHSFCVLHSFAFWVSVNWNTIYTFIFVIRLFFVCSFISTLVCLCEFVQFDKHIYTKYREQKVFQNSAPKITTKNKIFTPGKKRVKREWKEKEKKRSCKHKREKTHGKYVRYDCSARAFNRPLWSTNGKSFQFLSYSIYLVFFFPEYFNFFRL